MKILAIMQNQWFKEPERVRDILARNPSEVFRRRFIERALFAGCKTGRILQQVFGDMMDGWEFEEASPQIGGHSSSVFPANPIHISNVLFQVQPDVVIAFGRVAENGLVQVMNEMPAQKWKYLFTCHPAARSPDTMQKLKEAKQELDKILHL